MNMKELRFLEKKVSFSTMRYVELKGIDPELAESYGRNAAFAAKKFVEATSIK